MQVQLDSCTMHYIREQLDFVQVKQVKTFYFIPALLLGWGTAT